MENGMEVAAKRQMPKTNIYGSARQGESNFLARHRWYLLPFTLPHYIWMYISISIWPSTYSPCQLFGIVFQLGRLGDHSTRGTIVLVSNTLSTNVHNHENTCDGIWFNMIRYYQYVKQFEQLMLLLQ